MKAFSQDSTSLGTKSKEVQQKVRHHLFKPIPQYCINKFWISCFTHTFLTKPQLKLTVGQQDCSPFQHTKFSSSNTQNLTQPFPLGERSLHVPEQFSITGQKELTLNTVPALPLMTALVFSYNSVLLSLSNSLY